MGDTLHQSRAAFWEGKRVLLTGHSGFKGGWLCLWLQQLGAVVTGVSLKPVYAPNLFTLANIESLCQNYFCDIRDGLKLRQLIQEMKPEIVFHLAAQPLVRASYQYPVETHHTNIMGTVYVLDALRGLDATQVAVMITTDKVYRNREWSWPYREGDELGGHDPYSASKAACETIIDSYRNSFLAEQGVHIASARAGNVIGGGDWSEDRLIPDAIRAWQANKTLEIRSPSSIRPWQHVLEPVDGYLRLAEQLWYKSELSGSYNFGPESHEAATVSDVISRAKDVYGHGSVRFASDNAVDQGPHEAGWLALEITKARVKLGVSPRWNLGQAIERSMLWYRAHFKGADARELCLADIAAYEGDQ